MMVVLAERMGGAPVVFTRTESARAADPAELAGLFTQAGGSSAQAAASVADALTTAAALAGADGLVVACGSLYLVGDIKRRLGT